MNKRAVVSLILLFSLCMLPVSGFLVHAKHGSAVNHTWLHLHVLFGIIFCIAGVFHVSYNWKVLKNHLPGNKKN
jgi:uncharacterized membrane protein